VAGDRAFTVGNDGSDRDTLWCFDLNSGAVLWKHEYPAVTRIHEMSIVPYGPAATPAVADGKVWCISRDGLMQCVNAGTGELVWRKHLVNDLGGKRPVYGYAGSPAIYEGRLYADAGGSGGSNACLNAATGEVIWQTGGGEAGYSTPFVRQEKGGDRVVMFKGEALEIRSAEDGRLLARHATETRDFCNCATPVVVGDLYFISHTGNMGARVLELKGVEFTEKWTDRDFGLLFHSGIPWQGRLLAFNDQLRGANDLRLIDLKSGKVLWKNTEIEKGTGLLADDGHALLLTSKGELVLAKIGADRLDIQQRAQILGGKCWVQPVLSHRRLLCKNNDGSVVCLDLK
jgi:outer membrane protein assembly factor BamB